MYNSKTVSRNEPSKELMLAVPKAFLKAACEESKTHYARHLLSIIDNDALLSRSEIDVGAYDDPDSFLIDYSLSKFLSKYKGLKTGVDLKAVALTAFRKQEEVNVVTNLRLKRLRHPWHVEPVIHRARAVIAKALGPFSLFRFRGYEDWGPGASTDMNRSRAYLDSKIIEFPIPVTIQARGYLKAAIEEDLHWSFLVLGTMPSGRYSLLKHVFAPCEGSTVVTVPKNAKTDRTIAIEPRGNMFLQKAVGTVLRRILKNNGVDLDSQELNQQLAQRALLEELATIDLSMASDSVTTELIYLLLPVDWAMYLDDLRSKSYKIGTDENFTQFTKFSSMGNGFTFELESLLFWAIAKASCSEDECNATVSIYGDDIIINQRHAAALISNLEYFGFEVNTSKSYTSGRFFESCGKHYFDGIDVTPFYQKEVVDSESELIRLMNRIARWQTRTATEDALRGPWLRSWDALLRSLPAWAPRIPLGTEGDDGYLVNHSRLYAQRELRHRKSYGYAWKVIGKQPVSLPADEGALYAYTLRRGVVTETPYNGNLVSRTTKERVVSATRWVEPTWEFALD